VSFQAVAGTTYALCYASDADYEGDFTLKLVPDLPPKIDVTFPAAYAHFAANTPVLFEASANVPDGGSVDHVDFVLDYSTIGSVTNPPYQLSLRPTPSPYSHRLVAVAWGSAGLSTESTAINFYVDMPHPLNDDFKNRIVLSGSSVATTGTLAYATLEPGDFSGWVCSIWWSWKAPTSGLFTCTAGLPYDTFPGLAIFTGSSLGGLTPVPGSSVGSGLYTNRVVFQAIAGTTYQLAMLGKTHDGNDERLSIAPSAPPIVHITSPAANAHFDYGALVSFSASAQDDTGPVVLDFFVDQRLVATVSNTPFATQFRFLDDFPTYHELSVRASDLNGLETWDSRSVSTLPAPPANDDFAQRTPLDGFLVLRGGTLMNATRESGEQGSPSVWWSWAAPSSGRVHFQAITGGGVRFTIFTGDQPGNLVPVATMLPGTDPLELVFEAMEGTTYQLKAEGLADSSDFQFSLFLDAAIPAAMSPPVVLPNGSLRMTLSSLAEREWVLQGSTNFVDWLPLATNSSRWHVIDFADQMTFPAKFYRAEGR